MKSNIINIIVIFFALGIISQTVEARGSSKKKVSIAGNITQRSKSDIRVLKASENHLTNLHLGGYVGKLLSANETSWLQNALKDNPNMFEAFANPEGNTLAKCMWYGEFPGKILTGMAQSFRASGNQNTLAAGNKMVQMFRSVQGTDGYLGPWSKATRFNGDKNKWDTWGQYHCIYGLYQWYKITGNKDALSVALKAADCIYNYFILGNQTFVSQNWAECNFAICHVFAILYQKTRNKKYLDACEHILKEWKLEYDDFYTKRKIACDWLGAASEGKAFCHSNQPRWESLHPLMSLSSLYQITGNPDYYKYLEHFWWSIIQYDRHNFGGFGTGEGATGDIYGHGSETCSTVAWMAYSTEYLKSSKISYVADELEIAYYNAALGSLLGDHDFTYMNNSEGNRVSALVTLAEQGFVGGKQLSCCQANGNRGLSQLTEWAVLNDKDNLYLNYYGASNAETKTPHGTGIRILQETEYPKSGSVKITLNPVKSERFKLNLRIPVWSANTTVKVNGKTLKNVMPGDYCVIDRIWKKGDVVKVEFDMSVHFWIGEGNFANKTSIYYGPILLAMDTVCGKNSDYRLDVSNVRKIVFKDNKEFWFYGLVTTTGGKLVALVDYSSAGDKGEEYTTWLNVEHNSVPIHFVQGNNPIWNNIGERNCKITASAGKGGMITPNGDVEVGYGNRQVYNIVASNGYKIDKVLINGVPVNFQGEQYTFSHVTTDYSINVSFKKSN
ncbi:MAG: glycoside hydrolase family 127 protein [Bacteroidota bacterium]|nr:glycoside hydrolase family 127 protein [Bacteroidota bacterium]